MRALLFTLLLATLSFAQTEARLGVDDNSLLATAKKHGYNTGPLEKDIEDSSKALVAATKDLDDKQQTLKEGQDANKKAQGNVRKKILNAVGSIGGSAKDNILEQQKRLEEEEKALEECNKNKQTIVNKVEGQKTHFDVRRFLKEIQAAQKKMDAQPANVDPKVDTPVAAATDAGNTQVTEDYKNMFKTPEIVDALGKADTASKALQKMSDDVVTAVKNVADGNAALSKAEVTGDEKAAEFLKETLAKATQDADEAEAKRKACEEQLQKYKDGVSDIVNPGSKTVEISSGNQMDRTYIYVGCGVIALLMSGYWAIRTKTTDAYMELLDEEDF